MLGEDARPSDIAVIGLACRFPGAVSADDYWRLLAGGGSAVRPATTERWEAGELPPPAMAGFIRDHDRYDPGFFGISLAEARAMDPQQLLALQVTWHALEDARLDPARLAGREVGVFIGATSNDFEQLVMRQRRQISAFAATGTNASILSARISYTLDLRGACMTLNTACSSSLVAVHEACLHLRMGQCELAVAGGVNLLLAPETTLALSRAGMMAPDGACKTFDEAADGYVRGEGCGIVVLKPLAHALRDGDRIHAVVRGCAVNQDGLTNGLTAPNRHSQEALIRRALADAGLQAQDIGYVEAHGTGTKLGDPIEVNALKATYGAAADAPPCYLGAVKAQIGHLEPAAGIAGFVKCILQMKHRTIAPQAQVKTQNKLIKLAGSRLRISAQAVPWDESIPSCAGVSAFGYGGTNCHVVLSPPPRAPALAVQPKQQAGMPLVLPLAALDQLVDAHRQALSHGPEDAAAWCASVAHRPRPHALRRAYVGADATQLLRAMTVPGAAIATTGGRTRPRHPKLAFLFPGQGSQQAGMGRALYGKFAAFRQVFDAADEQMRAALGIGAADLLWGANSERLDQTDYTQPALYLLQAGLARVWQSLGVLPGVVVGHSIGEYAAAQVAGIFDFEQGLRMVLARGRLMQDHAPAGHMVAVRAGVAQVEALLAQMQGDAQLAAVNGAADVVIAVRPPALGALAELLDRAGLRHVKLEGNRAFHCLWMDEAAWRFARQLAGETFASPRIVMADNLGGIAGNDRTLDASYWVRQMVSPVRFHDAVSQPQVAEAEALVELGVGSTLLALASRSQARQRTLVQSIVPGEQDVLGFAKAAAALYEAGTEIEWAGLYPTAEPRDLPAYPFDTVPVYDAAQYRLPRERQAAPDVLRVNWEPLDASLLRVSDGLLVCLGGPQPLVRALLDGGGPDVLHVVPGAQPAASLEQALLAEGAEAARNAHAVVFGDAFAPRPEGPQGATALGLDGLRLLAQLQARPVPLRSLTVVLVSRGETSAMQYAPLAGALRSAALEVPGLHVKVVQVTGDADPASGHLLAALARADRGGEFRLAGPVLQEPVLQPQPLPEASQASIHPDRSYVVTGGAGTIGRHVLQALVARGARRIVVAGRSAAGVVLPVPDGVYVRMLACDVSSREDVERLLQEATQDGRRLGGIFHAAGVMAEMLAAQLTAQQWEQALAAKVAGTHWLSALAEPLRPDFMAAFSSVSSLWGVKGLSAYAAGNRFMDEWAQAAPAGFARIVIDWGPWQDSAMVSDDALHGMREVGIEALPSQAATHALFALLDSGARGRWAVCAANWPRLATLYAGIGQGGLFRRLSGVASQCANQPQPDTAGRTQAARDWRRQIRIALAALLDLPEDELPADEPLHALGIDSLRAIEFRRAVEQHTGLAVPATLVFDHPSLAQIEAHLAAVLDPAGTGGDTSTAQATPTRAPDESRDIAIIGLGCALPGGSDTPERFWRLLQDKANPVVDTGERWRSGRFGGPTENDRSFGAALIDGIDLFDARLFGVSPAEAKSMDPQQRICLELAWRCFEQAGYRRRDLKGRRVGTYLGVAANEYRRLLGSAEESDPYEASGNALNVVAGRIAFHFGLRGPAVTLDTACSSSLVALHQAIAALRAGECEMALAGGVNALLSRETFAALAQAKMLSPSWRCATFDAQADGYVRGEGAAMFLLKPLATALRDGDPVLAVLKGSAVNQDGRSASLTAPHGPAQVDVMQRALADAGLRPADVDWIEAHGTGTPLGDPIELRSIDTVYGDPARALLVGAVKSNIGHLESASGAVGLLKVVLALRHQQIPPNLHHVALNPHIGQLRCASLSVPTQSLPWPAAGPDGKPRRAAISSFGFSGTNAHLLVEEAPPAGPRLPTAHDSPWVLPLSANSKKSFDALVDTCRTIREPAELLEACRSACWQCEPLRMRAVLVAESAAGLQALLRVPVQPVEARRPARQRTVRLADDTPPPAVQRLRDLGLEVELVQDGTPPRGTGDGGWLATAAALFCDGFDIDWRQLVRADAGPRPVPWRYPMDKVAFWPDPVPASLVPHTSGDVASLLQAQARAMHHQLSTLETQLSWTA
jgi:acyl transferase domain-containing protein